MLDRAEKAEPSEHAPQRATPEQRTKVILMAQLVAIVALLVVWSILRSKRSRAPQ